MGYVIPDLIRDDDLMDDILMEDNELPLSRFSYTIALRRRRP